MLCVCRVDEVGQRTSLEALTKLGPEHFTLLQFYPLQLRHISPPFALSIRLCAILSVWLSLFTCTKYNLVLYSTIQCSSVLLVLSYVMVCFCTRHLTRVMSVIKNSKSSMSFCILHCFSQSFDLICPCSANSAVYWFYLHSPLYQLTKQSNAMRLIFYVLPQLWSNIISPLESSS